MAIDVTEEQDGSLTITWDPNNPEEAILSTWTEQDFLEVIREAARARLDKDVPN
jgi:hypothetical protein